jgi:hypothetical protein
LKGLKGVLAASALAVIVLMMLWEMGRLPASSVWAAWVQAIGSVGAILAAVWISYRQSVRAARLVLEDRVYRLRAILELVAFMEMTWTQVLESRGSSGRRVEADQAVEKNNWAAAESARTSFMDIPLYGIPSENFIMRVMQIRGHLNSHRDIFEPFDSLPELSEDHIAKLEQLTEHLRENVHVLSQEIEELKAGKTIPFIVDEPG